MDLIYASVPYPPSVGGGQLYTHSLARSMSTRGHRVRAVCQWSRTRNDWLYGATLRCREPANYDHEDVPVDRIGFAVRTRLRMLPWVFAYRQKPLRGVSIGAFVVHTTLKVGVGLGGLPRLCGAASVPLG